MTTETTTEKCVDIVKCNEKTDQTDIEYYNKEFLISTQQNH